MTKHFIIALLLLPVVFLAGAFAALAGMGIALGPDIGFAGAGLWLLMAPSSAVAIIVCALLAYTRTNLELPARHLTFCLLSPAISLVLALAVSAALFGTSSRSPLHSQVYVPGPDFLVGVDIRMDRTYLKPGERAEIQVHREAGPWRKVNRQAVPAGALSFPKKPAANDPALSGALEWHSEMTGEWEHQAACMQLANYDEETGIATATFSDPEGYGNNCRIWVTFEDRVRGVRRQSAATEVMIAR